MYEYLVGSPAFKAGDASDPRMAGSIPVHLRHRCSGYRHDTDHLAGLGSLPAATVRRSNAFGPWEDTRGSEMDMSEAETNDVRAGTGTDTDAEVTERSDADELRARARRIRDRAQELIDELGAGHPLVAQAIDRAEALEREAAAPGQIHLR